MNERELEKYFFLRIYSMDFDETRNSLAILKKRREKDVRYRLLRDIAVSYARPFSPNHGKLIIEHRCPRHFIPKEFSALHKELIDLRNERFAHSDLKRYNPRISRWKTRSGWGYPMSFRGLNYEKLDQRSLDIEKLVRDVADRLQVEISSYEKLFDAEVLIIPYCET
jgi:hypothetical protein